MVLPDAEVFSIHHGTAWHSVCSPQATCFLEGSHHAEALGLLRWNRAHGWSKQAPSYVLPFPGWRNGTSSVEFQSFPGSPERINASSFLNVSFEGCSGSESNIKNPNVPTSSGRAHSSYATSFLGGSAHSNVQTYSGSDIGRAHSSSATSFLEGSAHAKSRSFLHGPQRALATSFNKVEAPPKGPELPKLSYCVPWLLEYTATQLRQAISESQQLLTAQSLPGSGRCYLELEKINDLLHPLDATGITTVPREVAEGLEEAWLHSKTLLSPVEKNSCWVAVEAAKKAGAGDHYREIEAKQTAAALKSAIANVERSAQMVFPRAAACRPSLF